MPLDRPQRISPTAPIGALLKRTTVALRTAKAEPSEEIDHLALVRLLPCVRCGLEPCGVAAHLRANSGLHNKRQAFGRKPSHRWVMPLCSGCHTNDPDAQHRIGEELFWARIGVNPFLLCEQLWTQRGDFVAMHAVITRTIAERGKR
jgi:hypothetical protein